MEQDPVLRARSARQSEQAILFCSVAWSGGRQKKRSFALQMTRCDKDKKSASQRGAG